MKTRIIKTKFWADKVVQNLSPFAKLLFIYLLTSPYISLTCYFELTDGQIRLDTSLEKEDLEKAKKELEGKNRVFFYDGWVFIPNLDKHNPYKNSPKTRIAYEKELTEIPKNVLDYFNKKINTTIDSSIHSSMDTTPKTENIKHKTKNIKEKEIIKEKENLNSIISLFKEVNPSYERLFSNKTQRASLERLIKKYGQEWVVGLIKRLPEINKMPYAPVITTPYELETKLAKLKVFLEKEKNKRGYLEL